MVFKYSYKSVELQENDNPLVFIDIKVGNESSTMSLKFHYKPVELQEINNPLVFLKISIAGDIIGRVVIELFKHIVPSTAENFRALCTGEYGNAKTGQALHYKGSSFHKVVPYFMCQGGDIIAFDGSSGYSIYGPQFELENFIVPHNGPGVLSMVTVNETFCNSQFIITTTDCPHLDGRSVAFGRVVRGFSIIQEMSRVETNDEMPLVRCIIQDCGVLEQDENFSKCEPDETGDALPFGPEDVQLVVPLTVEDLIEMLDKIVQSAKFYYENKKYPQASQKFRKTQRYIEWIEKKINDLGLGEVILNEFSNNLQSLKHKTNLNLAATALELGDTEQCITHCDEALKVEKDNVKALYRKAKALRMVKNYNEALNLLQQAQNLMPNDSKIEIEIREIRDCQTAYLQEEKKIFNKMFDYKN